MSTELTITIQGQSLVFGVPIPAPAGESNDAANVGAGTAGVFRGKVGATLNFRTLAGTGGITITEGVDEVTIDGSGGGGGGGVNGPASSTDEAIARWDGTGGTLVQDSPVRIDDAGNLTTPGTLDGRDVGTDGAALDAHVASISNPHATTAAQVNAIPTTEKGAANGVATLDGASELTAAQIPASVASVAALNAHVADIANPHSVSSTQVGKDTAQWNANKLQGVDVVATAPLDAQVLAYVGANTRWEPTTPAGAGLGDVSGPASSTNNRASRFDGATGKIIQDSLVGIDDLGNITTPGTVDGRDVAADGAAADSHIANVTNPHSVTAAQAGADATGTAAAEVVTHEANFAHANIPAAGEKAALPGTSGVPGAANLYVTNADARNSDSRAPNGAASGQLGGTYPGPDIRGIRETAGPTLLTLGAIADGELLVRSGTTVVGTAAAAGGVRTVFFGADVSGNFGNYRARPVGSGGSFRFNFAVPADFVSLVALELIGEGNAANAAADIDLTSDYGAVGESAALQSETDTTITYNIAANTIVALDLSSVFSVLAAGDYAGVLVNHNGIGITMQYLGISLRYNT